MRFSTFVCICRQFWPTTFAGCCKSNNNNETNNRTNRRNRNNNENREKVAYLKLTMSAWK